MNVHFMERLSDHRASQHLNPARFLSNGILQVMGPFSSNMINIIIESVEESRDMDECLSW